MSFVVLMRHGEPVSPTDCTGIAASIMQAMEIIQAALAGIPPEFRFPRPIVISAPEDEATRRAAIIADELLTIWGVCDALAETIEQVMLKSFAVFLWESERSYILCSHAPTLEAFARMLYKIRGFDRPDDYDITHLERNRVVAINTDTMVSRIVEPPKLFLPST